MADSVQILWDDGERVFSRGPYPVADGLRDVLIARPAAEHPLPATLDRLHHEHGLRNALDGAWAVLPREIVRESGRPLLLFDDAGGEPLARLLDGPMAPGQFLPLAIGIATALAGLHKRGLVHKDLKPAHIMVHCIDGNVRLTGFGLASLLRRERQAPEPPETIAGTLAYMAPEQTGRMNRSTDSRSDLYALGVTFYQMLTGVLPFSASDAMEWVHCHIARQPVPVHGRVPTVPQAVSRLVQKLLAKTAEDRYQTAAGVLHDLQRCLVHWQRQGHVEEFALATRDTPDRLLVPEKLYGREQEVATMLAAFARMVDTGVPEVVLVSGYSGIGKSAVVSELHKALVPPRGLFASGKFDQYKRDIPYSTLVQAFQGLVRTLLGKPEAELAVWRDALHQALDPNARLMTDLIPELKLILGDPPPVAGLEPQQAQRRFLRVFQQFIGVFARAEHPLALFLDDLQWLDAATLDLIEDLLTHSELKYLMLIGAYRDNEVDAAHPLTTKLWAIRAAGVRIDDIKLAPLAGAHIGQLVAESLHAEPARVAPLAKLVQEKTGGNPFFVIQFLHALVDESLLTFDHDARAWHWEPERIHAKGYTDNVVDLMVGKLGRLPGQTQHALQQMACLGNVAGFDTLATVLAVAEAEVHAALWEAVRQELVERQDDCYAFAHDRVHEAAYSQIPLASRGEMHLRIGRLLAARTPAGQREAAIFEIVGQLNRGAALIGERAEQLELAGFNLLAARRAKASTAYASALNYLVTGAGLLEAAGGGGHELTFAFEIDRAECEFLTGQLQAADARLDRLRGLAATMVERSRVTCLQMDVCLVLDQSARAVAVCTEYLGHVGIVWTPHPSDAEVREEYDRIWTGLAGRSIESLIDLPLMDDPAALGTVEALCKLFAPALQTDANLACLLICKAVNFSMARGNADASCMLYANVCRVAGRRFGDYQTGYRFGRLGCELVERRGLKRFEARTFLCFSIFIARWVDPVSQCRALLDRAFIAANRSGDLAYAAYTRNSLVSDLLFVGAPLPEVLEETEQGLAYAGKVGFGLVTTFMRTQQALVRMLRGATPVFGRLDDERFSEAGAEAQMAANPGLALAFCWYWVRKLQARYLAGDIDGALAAAAQAEPLLWTSTSFFEEAEYHFYAALALAAAGGDGPGVDILPARREALEAHRRQLQIWADNHAAGFADRATLVAAEMARVGGRVVEAEHLYERAISLAQDSGFVHVEALGNELAARFHAARGLGRIARMYLQDARYGYLRWGAEGKVRQLEGGHPYLRAEDVALAATNTIAAPVEHLDLATVLKVSQAASADIVLERLIDRVMRTALEQAGATRGLLILCRGGEQRLAAEATIVGDATMLQMRDASPDATLLSGTVLNHVLRSRESVVLDDAGTDPLFAPDPYIRRERVRSVLCLPLMNQAALTGALYLENNLAAGAFSPKRIAVLKLVASQAAISLENARLYGDVAEREAKIRRLVDANIIGIVVWNAEGDIMEANDAFLRMVGYAHEDLVSGRVRWRDMTPPELRDESEQALAEACRTGRAPPYEKAYIRQDGSRVPVIVGLANFEASRKEGVAFVLDLSERKHAEELVRESERRHREMQTELAHANRVATMGQLAASIAHEVNQPIAATVTNAQAALRWLNMEPPDIGEAGAALGRIVKDANRAGDVLGRIRQMIRKAPPRKEAVDINGAVREVIELTAAAAAKGGATVHARLAEGLPSVHGDRVALQQVLMNLMVNAVEAMGVTAGGQRNLCVSTAEREGGVHVAVSDTGPGFGPDGASRIFAPFYTTKSTGLGMGLSICRSIVEAHGGELWAEDNMPRGAVIQFTVPAAAKAPPR
ncbi:trifunctional serine/threonine-protein kinase/ATP-binding protein/sensor histidine kinase [Cupriavidus agavae]|uniref:histidine kinase n=1 Tax=Cupriavidus agavae TaxID=1001822 RepID=A0A4Q7RTG4_9BURK|nr:AAA family ATPase [Cupriavidus agavae]RZT36894.1 PAS domain S-box-containing protein [Cupriavidus agavae]